MEMWIGVIGVNGAEIGVDRSGDLIGTCGRSRSGLDRRCADRVEMGERAKIRNGWREGESRV